MEKFWIRDEQPGSATLVLTWDPDLDPDLKMISMDGSGPETMISEPQHWNVNIYLCLVLTSVADPDP
jgi:hypothetical protein